MIAVILKTLVPTVGSAFGTWNRFFALACARIMRFVVGNIRSTVVRLFR
jgi:hypothetical protein